MRDNFLELTVQFMALTAEGRDRVLLARGQEPADR